MPYLGNRSIILSKLLVTALMVVAFQAANAFELDITSHKDKDYFIGYKKQYNDHKENCVVTWFASKWDTEYITSVGDCTGVSDDRVYSDAINAVNWLKANTKFENFAEYFGSEEKKDAAKGLYWDYMDGYQYKYTENCTVRWALPGMFMVPETCPKLSNEQLEADAIKSIKYAQSRSKAWDFSRYYAEIEKANKQAEAMAAPYSIEQSRADAREIWRQTCVDAKSLTNVTPLQEMSERYPGIDRIHAARLFSNARDLVKGLGGVLNCQEHAQYAVEMYASDIDIRAKENRQ